jgi:hypothetical protein
MKVGLSITTSLVFTLSFGGAAFGVMAPDTLGKSRMP